MNIRDLIRCFTLGVVWCIFLFLNDVQRIIRSCKSGVIRIDMIVRTLFSNKLPISYNKLVVICHSSIGESHKLPFSFISFTFRKTFRSNLL
jgi:hypothetical protein